MHLILNPRSFRLYTIMFCPVDTKNHRAVACEINFLYLSMFSDADMLFVPRVFNWTMDCFNGHYANYQAIDAHYHDLEHTLQVALCMSRLLHRRHQQGAKPILSRRYFQLGLLGILLHDTGYLKEKTDTDGTGAKYTLVHVDRSTVFAGELMLQKGFSPVDIIAVQNMIRCTGVNVNLATIPFVDDSQRLLGFALGTSDLLGQMAATDYLDKLPELFHEFEESARFQTGAMSNIGQFTSSEDLMRKTPGFWQHYVLPKLNIDFEGLYKFLNIPYPDGPNYYIDRIEANLAKLKKQFEVSSPV